MVELRHYALEAVGVTASCVISFLVAIGTRAYIDTNSGQLSLLIGMVSLIMGLVITNYVNSERGFQDLSGNLEDIKNLSDEFPEFQENPEHRSQFQRIVRDFMDSLNGHEFFQERAMETLNEFEEEMQELAIGKYKCNADSEMEPRITSDLIDVTQENIKAISYDEEDWWLSETGERYMKRHENLLEDKDVDIYRIFITPSHMREDMEHVFEWHEENEIHWDVISPAKFPQDFLDNVGEFVIYDGELLRQGEITQGGLANNIVVTTSTTDLNKKHSEFNEIANSTDLEISK